MHHFNLNKIARNVFLLIFCFAVSLELSSQTLQGKVVTETIYSKNLENKAGENPNRAVSVYLPPGYESSTQRYPVIYFLHGFMGLYGT